MTALLSPTTPQRHTSHAASYPTHWERRERGWWLYYSDNSKLPYGTVEQVERFEARTGLILPIK